MVVVPRSPSPIRIKQSLLGLLGIVILVPLGIGYAGVWWATALGAIQVVVMMLHTALWGWRGLNGWRYWYGLGAAITSALVLLSLLLMAIRSVRSAVRARASAGERWRLPSVRTALIGVPVFIGVFFGIPVIGTVIVVAGWPIVLPLLLANVIRARREYQSSA
jgi:hypothetical protein